MLYYCQEIIEPFEEKKSCPLKKTPFDGSFQHVRKNTWLFSSGKKPSWKKNHM